MIGPTVWVAVRSAPVVTGILTALQPGQQQMQLVSAIFQAPVGITPEQAAVNSGLFPCLWIRPATEQETAQLYKEHPEMAPAEVPSVFIAP